MPPKPFRVARLKARSMQPMSAASKDKLQLLTYRMALAQPTATVPLLSGLRAAEPLRDLGEPGTDGSGGRAMERSHRWVRGADELCVASMRRSSNINKINTYVATYKFEDPHWQPFLLPDVQVLPAADPMVAGSQGDVATEAGGAGADGGDGPPSGTVASASPSHPRAFDVFIDYNKLTNVELVSRHANFALRHIVQKGHAMYFVNYSQHSILEMRGLIEASHISCAFGIRGERLRTHLTHVGPLDVRDVVEIDPKTGRVSFNLKKKNVRKGVVAVSLVEGYGTWFQRKPMLWQRTRRIGALQSQMGAFAYELCPPPLVGRVHEHEVSLLEPHLRLMGLGGGSEAVGLIASSQVAQNARMYVGQFEAPVIAAIDAVQQLVHRTALHSRLVRAAGEDAGERAAGEDVGERAGALDERRRRLAMERILPVSWVTRTPPPYVPLEADLPFRIQLSKPAVFHTQVGSEEGEASSGGVVYPTGGTVGSPMVRGVPLSLFEYNIHQGVDHYIYDDAPSARPTKWWSQKSNMPYNGFIYGMRSGLLDYVVPAESVTNPLAPPSPAAHRRSSALSQTRKRERRRQLLAARRAHSKARRRQRESEAEALAAAEADAASAPLAQPLMPTEEEWIAGQAALTGHDDDALAAEAAVLAGEDAAQHVRQQRPDLADLVPPTAEAAARAARYERELLAETGAATMGIAKGQSRSNAREPAETLSAADALLRRQLRRRARATARKRAAAEKKPQGT